MLSLFLYPCNQSFCIKVIKSQSSLLPPTSSSAIPIKSGQVELIDLVAVLMGHSSWNFQLQHEHIIVLWAEFPVQQTERRSFTPSGTWQLSGAHQVCCGVITQAKINVERGICLWSCLMTTDSLEVRFPKRIWLDDLCWKIWRRVQGFTKKREISGYEFQHVA